MKGRKALQLPGVICLGKAFFAKDQHPHYLGLYLADTVAALRLAHGRKGWHRDISAFCMYDFDTKGNDRGALVFCRDREISAANLVHEVTHGAMGFLHQSMQSETVRKMKPRQQQEYAEELVARVTEGLFRTAHPVMGAYYNTYNT